MEDSKTGLIRKRYIEVSKFACWDMQNIGMEDFMSFDNFGLSLS